MVSSNLTVSQAGFASQTKFKKQKNLARLEAAPLSRSTFAPCPLYAHKNYAQINFRSALALHKSWGAAVDTAGNVNFKISTWPDVKKVYVQVVDQLHHQAKVYNHDGLEVVKHESGAVESLKTKMKNSQLIELQNKGEGVFEHKVEPGVANHGQNYRFVILKNDNTVTTASDPYSMRQPHVLGWSKIYDHNKYEWHDGDWMDHKVKERISREHYANGLKNPYNMSVYQIHIGALTKEGSYEAAKAEIKRAQEEGFDGIHIMSVENTFGPNWGYDGANKFAPQERFYGVIGKIKDAVDKASEVITGKKVKGSKKDKSQNLLNTDSLKNTEKANGPDKFKELIDFTHTECKMSVILDFVPNHMGVDGCFLKAAGPYSGGPGDFGDKFNYEGENSKNVREYMANAALNWTQNYHVDGLRFDMTKPFYMGSDFELKKIVMEVHEHNPDVFCIAEDGMDNRANITKPLTDWEANIVKREKGDDGLEKITRGSEQDHIDRMNWLNEKIYQGDTSILGNIGFDSEYDFPALHTGSAAVFGEWKNCSTMLYRKVSDFCGAITGSQHRFKNNTTQDEIGNRDGIVPIAMALKGRENLNIFEKMDGKDDCERGQRSAQFAHKIAKAIVTGRIDRVSDDQWWKFNKRNHMKEWKYISKDEAKKAFNTAIRQNKLLLGIPFIQKGPKNTFMGTDFASIVPFRFFREFSTKEPILERSKEKGYRTGIAAFQESKQTSIDYSPEYRENVMEKTRAFTKKLNNMLHNIPALNNGEIGLAIAHDSSSVLGVQRYKMNKEGNKTESEVYAVMNFNNKGYGDNEKYYIPFPSGKWKQIASSDSKEFGGAGEFENTDEVKAEIPLIKLPPFSIVFFEKVQEGN